jgi:hypothetical protein
MQHPPLTNHFNFVHGSLWKDSFIQLKSKLCQWYLRYCMWLTYIQLITIVPRLGEIVQLIGPTLWQCIFHQDFVKIGPVVSEILCRLSRLISLSMCAKFQHSESNRSRYKQVPVIVPPSRRYQCYCRSWVLNVFATCVPNCVAIPISLIDLYAFVCKTTPTWLFIGQSLVNVTCFR